MAYSNSQKNASRKYNENNYKRINMYLYPEVKEKWESVAKKHDMNLSKFIKMCVNSYISEKMQREKPE